MNNCGSSAWLVPTNVELDTRDMEVRDLSATNISCSNLSVKGNPISDVFQNVTASPGLTAFTGDVTAENVYTTDEVTAALVTSQFLTTGAITASSLSTTGGITSFANISGATLTGTLATATQNNVTKIGTQTSLSNDGALTQTGAATFATNITQSAGTAALRAVTATSISNSGTLTQTGAATFSTNITQSAGTSALKAVTADTVSVTGTTSLGAITFSGNLTQSTGTATFKALAADSLAIQGTTISTNMPSGTSYTATALTTNVAIYSYFTRITFQGVSSAVAYNLYLALTNAIGSTSGTSYGSNGATEVSWGTRQVQLYNTTAVNSIAAGSKGWGHVDIIRVSATEYQVLGEMIYKSANNYTVSIVGTITNPFALNYTIGVNFTNTPASGSIIVSTGW